ncbi:MAG: M48 family metallopeptidase [Alphaproteobacteria bacterium]|nr:M48 family metallopeptidase [Alphaproteobacteria bacterium]
MTNDSFALSTGEEIPIIFTPKPGARNITLRPKVAPVRELHVSLPRWTAHSRAHAFIREKRAWLEKIFARAPMKIKINPGDTINIFGNDTRLLHANNKSQISNFESQIIITGQPEFFERRVRDKIKAMFLDEVKKILREVPRELRPAKICVRDTTSRWGSCSSSGAISLSWRLSFAPPAVMRYVIMHELAHRKHMDHSPQFWNLVAKLFGPGMERTKGWLSKNGQSLHRYL